LRNIAILLRYDGTNYHGWQTQKKDITVCKTVEQALEKTVGHPVSLHGCGRTDAGVHAERGNGSSI
jgi:tRNA pseudouridine38-40 synthase